MDSQKIPTLLPYLTPRAGNDGIPAFNCPADKLFEAVSALKDAFDLQTLSDIAAFDMGLDAPKDARFGAAYHFFSHTRKAYLRLVTLCADSENPELASIVKIYPAAEWQEREAFDMMGIKFTNHPDMRRILMWDAYTWNPLRKDFPLAGNPAPLPDSFEGNEDATRVITTPMEGGPFTSPRGDAFAPAREPRSRA